jgi:hypothetical protein
MDDVTLWTFKRILAFAEFIKECETLFYFGNFNDLETATRTKWVLAWQWNKKHSASQAIGAVACRVVLLSLHYRLHQVSIVSRHLRSCNLSFWEQFFNVALAWRVFKVAFQNLDCLLCLFGFLSIGQRLILLSCFWCLTGLAARKRRFRLWLSELLSAAGLISFITHFNN